MRMQKAVPSSPVAASLPIWVPSPQRVEESVLTRFTGRASEMAGYDLTRYGDLHRWSVDNPGAFWSLLWDFADVIGDRGGQALQAVDSMWQAQFFPDATLNFAQNCLAGDQGSVAIIWSSEEGETRSVTRHELKNLVARFQKVLLVEGIGPGDKVAALATNRIETIAAMLACAATGAVWVGCAPEFGVPAILDRFRQAAPKLMLAVDSYTYGGKRFSTVEKLRSVTEALPGLRRLILIGQAADQLDNCMTFDVATGAPDDLEPTFIPLPFDHPLCVLFSSGTTGKPKAIVHRAGGVLLQHIKEHQLHCDIKPGDRIFQYSTISWMMWNWQISALASGATLLVWDGAPMMPSADTLLDFTTQHAVTHFGTSAGYLDALRKAGCHPRSAHDLSTLRCITSTGSPLSVEGFRYVYQSIASDVHLASISGGTDILSCFVLGNPNAPVFAGEIQALGLGMAVEILDAGGLPAVRGDLTCTKPFPSMPLGFLDDDGGQRYCATYFEHFHGIWHHGDDASFTQNDGIVIHGRSDATLNPGGVRIGTAEVYSPLAAMPEILEAACIGQNWHGDIRLVLFVRLAEGVALTADLMERIRHRLRSQASPRHVPARIIAVPDLPKTLSGKISEIAIAHTVNGRELGNVDALSNPICLSLFQSLNELST
jgi:acetoacetyl-CoA synthetase